MKTGMVYSVLVLALGAVCFAGGCREVKHAGGSSPAQLGKAKLDALQRIAEAVAKNPNDPDLGGMVDEFRQIPLDITSGQKEIQEIVKLYKERVQGKLKGILAQQVQEEINNFQAASKR